LAEALKPLSSEARPSVYKEWLKTEGIPVIDGHYVENLITVPVEPWKRRGGLGVYINHDASDRSNDCYVCEIPPGGSLLPQRHLFEEMIYVLRGRGASSVWQGDGPQHTFEWREGSLFAIPLNAWHQHFNGQGSDAARFLAVTNAPVVMNLFQSAEFAFTCEHVFTERFAGERDYFDGGGVQSGRIWNTNFVPDVRTFHLVDYSERGAGGTNIKYRLARNSMMAHVSEFEVGTYKKGHRHGPGAHVLVLTGQGYSLMWPDGQPIKQFPWGPGSLVIPPDQWFHQHFNTGSTPARYLALRLGGGQKYREDGMPFSSIDRKLGGNQIEYEDEDPLVRRLFTEACRHNGVEPRMERFWAGAAGRAS
jgi:quercetin dioxygenase-like cupin family protein